MRLIQNRFFLRSILSFLILLLSTQFFTPVVPAADSATTGPLSPTANTKTFANGPLDPPGPIDAEAATSTFTVTDADFPQGSVVYDVIIDINFSKVGGGTTCPGPHGGDDWAEEVRMRLYAPNGTRVALVRYDDYNYSNPDVGPVRVTFSDQGTRTVENSKIQDGTFLPSSGAMADYRGIEPAVDGGEWVLELSDLQSHDPLCFISADLHITTIDPGDLSVHLSDTPDPVMAGDLLNYSFGVYNAGPDLAPNAILTDTLPLNMEPVAFSEDCTLSTGSAPGGEDQLICDLSDLTPGAKPSFQALMRVPADAVALELNGLEIITNTLEANAIRTDPLPGNNMVVENTFVSDLADLQITKLSQPSMQVQAGEVFTYTIYVDNYGPSFARNVSLEDSILSSDTFSLLELVDDPNRADNCATQSGSGDLLIKCTIDESLEPVGFDPLNGRWSIQVVVRANQAQEVTNLVQVYSQDPDGSGPGTKTPDSNLQNNQALNFVSVNAVSDLQVMQSAVGLNRLHEKPTGVLNPMNEQVTAGNKITYTLTTSNLGPSTARNVSLEDYLPAGTTLLGGETSQGVCNFAGSGSSGLPQICNLGDLTPSTVATVTFGVEVASSVPTATLLQNQALVSSDTFDPNNLNDISINETRVTAWADLSLNMQQQPATVFLSDMVEYVIHANNQGPSDAPGLNLVDILPAGIQAVSWECTPFEGASCAAFGSGNINDQVFLPNGGELEYRLQGTLTQALPMSNTVQLYVPFELVQSSTAVYSSTVTNSLFTQFVPLVILRHVSGAWMAVDPLLPSGSCSKEH